MWPANRGPASASLCLLAAPREAPGAWSGERDSKGTGVALGRKGQTSPAPPPATSQTRRSVPGLLLSPGAGLPQADAACGLGGSSAAASQSPCAAQLRTAPTSWRLPSGPGVGPVSPGLRRLRVRQDPHLPPGSPRSPWLLAGDLSSWSHGPPRWVDLCRDSWSPRAREGVRERQR